MTRRLLLLSALPGPLLWAAEDPRDFLGDLTSYLAAGDAQSFLRLFDENMAGFAELQRRVLEMVGECEVSSSVDVISQEAAANGDVNFTLDWGLELRTKSDATRRERRSKRVAMTLRPHKKTWRVAAFTPVDLFGKLAP